VLEFIQNILFSSRTRDINPIPMRAIPKKTLKKYREKTFRLLPGERLKSQSEAVDFVNQRGFVYFWPIKDITLPSLWTAVAGDRQVADAHDDPGHVTWGWKDALLGGEAWYYAKVLRKRATMISFDVAPHFYALSENYGAPEDDYLTLYEQGRLTQEAKVVYEVLLDEGPLDTIALRRKTRMTSRSSDSRFNRAMTDLQADFKILPVAVTQAGGWRYAFAYDIVARHYPELPEQAHHIRENEARKELVRLYFRSVGAAQMRDVRMIFRWHPRDCQRAVQSLVEEGLLVRGRALEKHDGEWFALRDLGA
jgi:hypothetical protein